MTPYDPRHESEGGNRTTSKSDLKAAKGQYRVVLVDTFDGSDCVVLNTKNRNKAIAKVDEYQGRQMIRCYAYDDKGNCIRSAGSF